MSTFQVKSYKIQGRSTQDAQIICFIESTESTPDTYVKFTFVSGAQIQAPTSEQKTTSKGTPYTDVTVYVDQEQYPWYVDLLRNELHVYIDASQDYSVVTLRSQYSDIKDEGRLWGFADLHAHPASHLAFGGMFWGNPGLTHHNDPGMAMAQLAKDLPPCDADKHGGFTFDFINHIVQKETAAGTLSGDSGEPAIPHSKYGWPVFTGWPHALSPLHQQMHIEFIHRAYCGGLRLMVASVTHNQLLAAAYNFNGWQALFGGVGADPQYEMQSAITQLKHIQLLAATNPSWMQIVKSPREARKAIRDNKLAIILSVEMDSLNADQLIALSLMVGVRHITPIHLADNKTGGAALYNSTFNTVNYFLNGAFFKVSPQSDPMLRFKLKWPQVARLGGLDSSLVNIGILIDDGDIGRQPISQEAYDKLHYPDKPGHKNARGLDKSELLKLMQAGLLIDLAHMSETAQEEALTLAESHDYPVMNTHTGLRKQGVTAESERFMLDAHAMRMAKLGGVIGLGTAPSVDEDADQVSRWANAYLEALRTMNQRGVALGTDFNGFASQIPGTGRSISYPIRILGELSRRMDGPELAPLPQFQLGPVRTYDFKKDGLAHYGMIPDFIAAIAQDERVKKKALSQLFRTAEATIEMWEKVEASADRLRTAGTA